MISLAYTGHYDRELMVSRTALSLALPPTAPASPIPLALAPAAPRLRTPTSRSQEAVEAELVRPERLSSLRSQSAANILWSFASLRHMPTEALQPLGRTVSDLLGQSKLVVSGATAAQKRGSVTGEIKWKQCVRNRFDRDKSFFFCRSSRRSSGRTPS